MRILLFPIVALGLLAACDQMSTGSTAPLPASGIGAPTPSDVAGAAIPPRQGFINYLCADGRVVQAQYDDMNDRMSGGFVNSGQGGAYLYVDGQGIRMLQGASANGARYIGGGYQWLTRGLGTANLALLGPNESTASNPGTECRANA